MPHRHGGSRQARHAALLPRGGAVARAVPGCELRLAAAKHFGVPGAMASAESAMIGRDIALALDTGARVLFQHVSSAQSVALIRAGKAMGAEDLRRGHGRIICR